MCTENICSTFVWGGPGYPELDTGGLCSCVCYDGTWSDLNILGRASCVPGAVHTVFGGVGLALSVAVLCHAIYHRRRQVSNPPYSESGDLLSNTYAGREV